MGGKGKRKAEKGCRRGKKLPAIFRIKGKNLLARAAAATAAGKTKSDLSPISGQQTAGLFFGHKDRRVRRNFFHNAGTPPL